MKDSAVIHLIGSKCFFEFLNPSLQEFNGIGKFFEFSFVTLDTLPAFHALIDKRYHFPIQSIYRDLTLDEAIRLYQDSDRPEKRLGVTKDGIATVDLVRFCDGEQQFFEDYRRLESFRDDPAISDAAETIRQELKQTAPQEDITMGGM